MGEARRRKLAGTYPEITKKPSPPPRSAVMAPDGGLDWEVVGDLADHPRAQEVLDALQSLKNDVDPDAGGNVMQAALEAPSGGNTVVVARSLGLGNWMQLIGAFQGLGLTDRLEHLDSHREPYDAIFS
ncbi:hypothetical protein D3C71_18860 [compost metagenome]